MRLAINILLALGMLAGAVAPDARAQNIPRPLRQRFEKLIRDREIKPSETPPDWFNPDAKPLFRFVQIADIHLTPSRIPLLKAAAAFINEKVKPAFVAITGDNAGSSDPDRQALLKGILDRRLKSPYHIIRGDNWARNFSKVFGSTRYVFECGGVRFVFTGLDHDCEGMGVGRFAKETWDWMRKEFAPEGTVPVVLFLHENIQPPVFLDAGKLDSLLEASQRVCATFTGHLHCDLEFQVRRVKHVIAPGFGPHRLHGFKVCEVHHTHIAVRTVELREGKYAWAQKYQKVRLPCPPKWTGTAKIVNFRSLPARETVFDVKPGDATPGILFQMALFARRAGLYKEFLEATKDAGKGKGKGEDENEEGF